VKVYIVNTALALLIWVCIKLKKTIK